MTYKKNKKNKGKKTYTQYKPNKNAVKSKKSTTTNYTKPVSKVSKPKKKTAEELQRERELQEMVAAQLTDRRFAPVTHEELDKPVTYVTARNGLFKVTKKPIGLFKEQIEEFKNPLVGIPEMEPGVDLVIPKIPMHLILEALSWYKDVNDKDKTECSTLYFWNHNNIELPEKRGLREEGQFIIYCPVQENTSALSEFGDDTFVDWLRENTALLLELHSHQTENICSYSLVA